MALTQYVPTPASWLSALHSKTDEPIWQTWRKHYLWTSITYFAGACAAGVIAGLVYFIGVYAFVITLPIIAIIFLTYRTYLKNVETSAAQAAQAENHVKGTVALHHRAGAHSRTVFPNGKTLRARRAGVRSGARLQQHARRYSRTRATTPTHRTILRRSNEGSTSSSRPLKTARRQSNAFRTSRDSVAITTSSSSQSIKS